MIMGFKDLLDIIMDLLDIIKDSLGFWGAIISDSDLGGKSDSVRSDSVFGVRNSFWDSIRVMNFCKGLVELVGISVEGNSFTSVAENGSGVGGSISLSGVYQNIVGVCWGYPLPMVCVRQLGRTF